MMLTDVVQSWMGVTGLALALVVSLAGTVVGDAVGAGPSWQEVQAIKREMLAAAAQNAMAQQKRDVGETLPLPIPVQFETGGQLEAQHLGDGRARISATARPWQPGEPGRETLRFELDGPIDMLAHHSGLAMTVRVGAATSPEVRWGVRLIGADGRTADILPSVPVRSAWNDDVHEIYLDWAFIRFGEVDEAAAVLRQVVALEFSVAAQHRTPERGPSREARRAAFELSDLRLVDYLQGSYDPDRHRWGWDEPDTKSLTLQHRTQEVSGVVATFGGDAGIASAIESLNLAARTQCWDGSFLDGRRGARTVTSGEYTHGFTLWGLMDAYERLEAIDRPELDETVTIGPATMTRREAYQRMIYRGAMSRGSLPPSQYRDDIIGGNTLITGANRVLGFAIAMRRAADLLHDAERRETVMARFDPFMDEIVAAQGAFSGGFPLLGEGNRYDDRGIHYDAGYIRTHMDWLVIGIRATGEPRLVEMFARYQPVIEAAMDERGRGIMRLLSERGRGTSPVQLVLPDATAQMGLEHGLPVMAQWGYNVGAPQWARYEPGEPVNHFTWASRASGYSLGAHAAILLGDMQPEPAPRDIGYRFPRQFPIWSSRFFDKEAGQRTRTSRVTVHADGRMVNDFRIEVGEYLETVGVPVVIEVASGSVAAEAVSLRGWPALLGDDAELTLVAGDETVSTRVGETVELTLAGETRVVIEGPAVKLPTEFGGERVGTRAELVLTPNEAGQIVRLRVVNEAVAYMHEMASE
ncbi:MAG: hypothetical protein WD009_06155 [Phycisphaeraceae bacterium]